MQVFHHWEGKKKKTTLPDDAEKDETELAEDKEGWRQRDWKPGSLHYPLASLSGSVRVAALDGLS